MEMSWLSGGKEAHCCEDDEAKESNEEDAEGGHCRGLLEFFSRGGGCEAEDLDVTRLFGWDLHTLCFSGEVFETVVISETFSEE